MDRTATRPAASSKPRTSASPQYIFSQWEPWANGIDRAVGTADLAFDTVPPTLSAPVVRKQYVNALRISLADVSFYTTPRGGPYHTLGDTITGFLDSEPVVTVAINANFSWATELVKGNPYALFGLAISQGQVVCDPTQPANQPAWSPPPEPPAPPDVPNQGCAGAMAMLISSYNDVTFQLVTAENPDYPANTNTAIAGSPQPTGDGWPPEWNQKNWPPQAQVPGPDLLVRDGLNQATPSASPAEKVTGRTAVGLSADGQQYLYLVTLDGCDDVTAYGGGFYDIAQWLIIAGAYTGLNLDGGGSTAMAGRDSNNNPVVMNLPFGDDRTPGLQRVVGNFLGVVSNQTS